MFKNQEIGINDKNGTPIKEGDTVRFRFKNTVSDWKVIYGKETASFMMYSEINQNTYRDGQAYDRAANPHFDAFHRIGYININYPNSLEILNPKK